MELVDTHCHIQSIGNQSGEKSTSELWAREGQLTVSDVVARATQAGVNKLLVVGCSLEDSRLAIEVASKYDNLSASIGIHPHEAKEHIASPDILAEFALLAERPEVIAIGECGLDYYYDHSARDDQKKMLEYQLELALRHNLPLIFHVREAYADFWPTYDKYNSISRPLRGVLHSFTDSAANLDMALERGLYIGVNGIATFCKEQAQIDMYKQIPLMNLVLETDSPFLTPSPIRGKINEPKNVEIIARFLANLRGENLDQLASLTTANTHQLFGI